MHFSAPKWSPVEIEWLKKNLELPVSQLTIALAKSTTAVKRKMVELGSEGKDCSSPKVAKPNTSHKGRRPDCNNQFFRSSWEANVFRWLSTKLGKGISLIEYEPATFSFAPFKILKGTVSYTPDFRIRSATDYNWIEVKGGFMKAADRTKIKRFKKFYPDEFKRLVAVVPGLNSKTYKFFQEMGIPILAHYPDLNKTYRHQIANWE